MALGIIALVMVTSRDKAATEAMLSVEALIRAGASHEEVERAIAELQRRLLEWQLLCM